MDDVVRDSQPCQQVPAEDRERLQYRKERVPVAGTEQTLFKPFPLDRRLICFKPKS